MPHPPAGPRQERTVPVPSKFPGAPSGLTASRHRSPRKAARLSPEASAAIRRAHELAEDRRDADVSPAHLMLGVLAEPTSSATSILFRYEVGPARLSSHLCRLLPPAPTATAGCPCGLSDAATKSLAIAAAEASSMHTAMGAGHIMLGLLSDRGSVVGMILRDHGLTEEGVRTAIRRHLEQ